MALLLALGLACAATPAHAATTYALTVKIVQAQTTGHTIDPRLGKLAKELAGLKKGFTSFVLADQATMALAVGATGRMQLPNGEWMRVVAAAAEPGDKLRLELAVKKLEFRATAIIAPGATLAVAGPKVPHGRLILAISRAKK